MNQILHRKLQKTSSAAPPQSPTTTETWPLHLARALRESLDMMVQVRQSTQVKAELIELSEYLPDDALYMTLETVTCETGVMAISNSLVAALIEVQTTGRVFERQTVARRATRIDAALIAPVIELALAARCQSEPMAGRDTAGKELADLYATPFFCGTYLEDSRPIGLLLEELPYNVEKVQLRFGDGTRQGEVMIALPLQSKAQKPQEKSKSVSNNDATLADVTAQAQCKLQAVLAKLQMPLEFVINLQVGQMLHLGTAELGKIALHDQSGSCVAWAKLGQQGGGRALRLTDFAAQDGEYAQATFTEPASDFGKVVSMADVAAAPSVLIDPTPAAAPEPQFEPPTESHWPESELDLTALTDPIRESLAQGDAPEQGEADPLTASDITESEINMNFEGADFPQGQISLDGLDLQNPPQ